MSRLGVLQAVKKNKMPSFMSIFTCVCLLLRSTTDTVSSIAALYFDVFISRDTPDLVISLSIGFPLETQGAAKSIR